MRRFNIRVIFQAFLVELNEDLAILMQALDEASRTLWEIVKYEKSLRFCASTKNEWLLYGVDMVGISVLIVRCGELF